MLSIELGKEFLKLYVFLLDFKVILSNPWRSIKAVGAGIFESKRSYKGNMEQREHHAP
jgi:hypothetical protein